MAGYQINGSGSTTIEDSYGYNVTDFNKDLAKAQAHAKGERECDFVEQIRERYQKFGVKAYLSEKQYEWLVEIACRK